MPKGLPPLTLKEFRKIMKHFGYIELKGNTGSHIAFVEEEEFQKNQQKNANIGQIIWAERIGATIPHGGSKNLPRGDVQNAIRSIGVSKEEFYAVVNKQIPGKNRKKSK